MATPYNCGRLTINQNRSANRPSLHQRAVVSHLSVRGTGLAAGQSAWLSHLAAVAVPGQVGLDALGRDVTVDVKPFGRKCDPWLLIGIIQSLITDQRDYGIRQRNFGLAAGLVGRIGVADAPGPVFHLFGVATGGRSGIARRAVRGVGRSCCPARREQSTPDSNRSIYAGATLARRVCNWRWWIIVTWK